MYVLRKGTGAYSAGTAVDVLTDHPDNHEIRVLCNDDIIFVPGSMVVERRPMVRMQTQSRKVWAKLYG